MRPRRTRPGFSRVLTLISHFFSFQRKVEMFHEGLQSGVFGDSDEGYVSRTIALVNCCPPFRYKRTLTPRSCTPY